MRRVGLASVVVLLALGFVTRSIAADDAYKIIVHPDNPTTSVDRDFLRKAYLKKAVEWKHGEAIHPVDLPAKTPARDKFVHDVLKKTPEQLKAYWNQQIFSGKAVPPPEVGSPAEMIGYVVATPGAIGYLPSGVDPGGAKVVEVK